MSRYEKMFARLNEKSQGNHKCTGALFGQFVHERQNSRRRGLIQIARGLIH